MSRRKRPDYGDSPDPATLTGYLILAAVLIAVAVIPFIAIAYAIDLLTWLF